MSFMKKKLWRWGSGKSKPVEIQANGEVYSVAFSPDARHVIGGGQGRTVGQWRVENGRAVGEPMQLSSYLLNVAASKDGRYIALGGSSGLAQVWDVNTHRKVVEAVGSERVFGVDVSPDSSKFVAASEKNVAVWSIPTGERLLGPLRHEDFVAAVKFSPRGDRIATATWEHNSIRLYDSADGQLLFDIPDKVSSPYNTSLVWSADGHQLVIACHAGKIKCFHVSGSFLSWTEWDAHPDNQPMSIAIADNGKFIVSASSRFISFWDVSNHARIGPVIEQSERVWSVALSSDGHLASGGDDKKITIRNLKNILPRPYFLDHSDNASGSRPLPPSQIIPPLSSLAEARRLQALLAERDKAIQESRNKNDDLEQRIKSLSNALHAREGSSDKLQKKVSELEATIQALRTQLSDAQEISQKLTQQLDESFEEAERHKLESKRIMTALEELKAKHEIELAQAQESAVAGLKTGTESRSRGIGIGTFESWMRDHSITASTAFAEATNSYSTADYNALACFAFTQARSRNWSAAYEDAEKSLSIQPSAIGHIAKAIALVGQSDYKAAMRAFALVFRDGDPSESELMMAIWAILSCLAGEYIDAILRIHGLDSAVGTEKTTYNCIQAYMYILLGNKYMNKGDYEHAVQVFDRARSSYSPHRDPRLETISFISGWSFDGLGATAQKRLDEALCAAGGTRNTTVGVNT